MPSSPGKESEMRVVDAILERIEKYVAGEDQPLRILASEIASLRAQLEVAKEDASRQKRPRDKPNDADVASCHGNGAAWRA